MVKNAMERKQGILVSITGWSGSGKTTFITACITRLHKAGYRVYALKSTHMKLGETKRMLASVDSMHY